ncbi:Na+/H+ antiporter NhaC family protein [Gimesia fumaroli]|uniref:Malate-2H(+)/Na(+)-lactate antiporter n=1 Tax=Gimesia fumaroli TaxID=2527976 RepID=A0A518I888_9PLAN|nr:Na+/H+ antiporter NhaC family protein [Gimesia fumaroli]QDV49317.1 Malate-2H(+)/Na(+)-lactate antiporter [Gimesia fumaroli]
MAAIHSFLIILTSFLGQAEKISDVPLKKEPARYAIEAPDVVVVGVPVSKVTIRALNVNGSLDTTFSGHPQQIIGIDLWIDEVDTALPPFKDGILELKTDLAKNQKVFVTSDTIVVDPDIRGAGALEVYRISRWLSLLPPIVAVVLAVWFRNIILALLVSIWCGAVILAHGNLFLGFVHTLDTFVIHEIVEPGSTDNSHMMIILFTMFLGAMVGVMSVGGGTAALVNRLSQYATKREHSQLMTWFLGLVVFFDDYANSLLVGSSMRPLTDRMKVSREKLAFLVDSTAAPVSGIAIISTWVGVEIGYIADSYASLGMAEDYYTTFLYSLPYRFYPLQLLAFVWLVAYLGHDFGPMLKAEVRTIAFNQVMRPGRFNIVEAESSAEKGELAHRQLLRNALIPLSVLLGLAMIGLWWTGTIEIERLNLERLHQGELLLEKNLRTILEHASPNRVLLISSFLASIAAVASCSFSKSLSLNECVEAWSVGAKSMFLAILILVLAWSVATVCDEDHLNTAGVLVEMLSGHLSPNWMPTITFLLAAAVSFATGSSWSTMGLIMPLSISVTYSLLVPLNEAEPNHHLMLGTIGGVLAGAIFGDHCSPISDTTVLSSAASGSDHLDHVLTQMPYAMTVAVVSVVFGYIPVGFGIQPYILLPVGLIVLFLILQFYGRSAEAEAEAILEAGVTAEEYNRSNGGESEEKDITDKVDPASEDQKESAEEPVEEA